MDNLPFALLTLTLLGYFGGVAAGLVFWRENRAANVWCFGLAATAASCGVLAAGAGLFWPEANSPEPWTLIPSLTPVLTFTVRLDGLGLFFFLVLSLLGVALSIYALGYAKSFFGRKPVGAMGALYNGLLLSTTLVFLSSNFIFFLFAWELMALTAYALVSFDHENTEARNAGVLYFVMSHIGTGCLILGFLVLFQASGSGDFTSFHALGERMAPGPRNAAFLFFLAGFGVKAGIVPLHIWLPAAHPVAPSHVSALLSGVLIKTGIYGMARVLFDFLGTPPMWWGVTVLVIGTVSAVLGVLYALMEHDLKRLLAYHSIENIGIILMGFGAALMFQHTGHPVLASMALIAGLYHTINHAAFKALLFLGAGAVLHATHTRNMEELGGLIKKMPATAFFFLFGAVAISALPPLNGFVSEWLTYQSLLQGFGTTESLVRLMFPLSGALLALTGALAAACFVKAFGITFLAQARSNHVARAHEASPSMLIGMGLLTALCAFLGLFPGTFLRVFDPITTQLTGQAISAQLTTNNGWVLGALSSKAGSVSTVGMMLMAICLLPIPAVLWWVFARKALTRIGPTWDCGLQGLTPRMQYTATGFSKPLRMIFRGLFRPRREIQSEFEFSRYFKKAIHFESHIEETFEQRLYRPLNRIIQRASRRMRALQAGSIQAYLIYVFAALLLLLIFAL